MVDELYGHFDVIMTNSYSWGRIQPSMPAKPLIISHRRYHLENNKLPMLAVGNLRSYGDEAYNDNGVVMDCQSLNKFIAFDRVNGYLTAECGVTLEQILQLIVPCGWFLPVTPGTQYATLAGAIANDVHGKNHHKSGSFGCFVEAFELVRSNGERLICSKQQHAEYYFASIGGMGLTGWISWAKIKLLQVSNNAIVTRAYKFANLQEFFHLNTVLEKKFTYTVTWIDCLAKKKNLGRGITFVGEHAGYLAQLPSIKAQKLGVPLTPPFSMINQFTLKAFNTAYYRRPIQSGSQIVHYAPFFYPLDNIRNWNRLYGKKGFYQYQCVVPMDDAYDAIKALLTIISNKKMGSFLITLKTFGQCSSGGMLSFPRPGVTLALDFANQGDKTLALFAELDSIVLAVKGALYPGKDARMSPEMFACGYPALNEFTQYIDPQFSSNLWRRIFRGA